MNKPYQMREVLLFVGSKMADKTSPSRKHAYIILIPFNPTFI